jgi:oxygen-dependent protoporphyrinogen oxidase
MALNPATRRVVVVGGGLSGLAVAWRLALARPDVSITVLEAAARFGGKLISEHRDGFVVEAAADGFLARKPPALAWARELGLGPELIEPRPEHRLSHVLWGGGLHRLPEGFSGLVPTDPEGLRRSTLLSPQGIEAAVAEPLAPPRLAGTEESVAQFLTRRYGRETFERLMEPLLAGIFAGDAEALSAEAAFPQLVSVERRGLSLTHGLAGAPPPEPGPAFRSFASGMARFPAALEAALRSAGVTLTDSAPVSGLVRAGEGWEVQTSRQSLSADAIVLVLPPRAAGALVRGVSPSLASVLESWPVSSVASLTLAFGAGGLDGLPSGSGFVAPRAGGTRFSAATWSSQKWPQRAPSGGTLVRIYFGGARDPQGWARPEDDLVEDGLRLLAQQTGTLVPKPLWHRVFRWRDAFAQPNLGHAQRHADLAAAAVPGLVLAGGYFAGPGIPDCLARAQAAAAEVGSSL